MLQHPNIVTVYDMGEDESRLYFVMELLDGEIVVCDNGSSDRSVEIAERLGAPLPRAAGKA